MTSTESSSLLSKHFVTALIFEKAKTVTPQIRLLIHWDRFGFSDTIFAVIDSENSVLWKKDIEVIDTDICADFVKFYSIFPYEFTFNR